MEFSFPVLQPAKVDLILIFDGVQISRSFEVQEDPSIHRFSKSFHKNNHLIELQVSLQHEWILTINCC